MGYSTLNDEYKAPEFVCVHPELNAPVELNMLPIISNTQYCQALCSSHSASSCSSHMSADRGPLDHCPKQVPATCPDQPSAPLLTPTLQVAATWSSRGTVMPGRRAHKSDDATGPLSSGLNLPCFSPSPSSPHLSCSRLLNIISRRRIYASALAVLPPICSATRLLPRIPMDGLLLDTLTRLASEALASNLRSDRSKRKLT
jgi:hypothetical protein